MSVPVYANPFRLQADPDVAIAHQAWRRARVAAMDALGAGGQAVLLGPAGSGKSLLLRELAGVLRGAGTPFRLVAHAGSFDGVAGDGALLVDEADTLGAEVLAALCDGAGPVLLAGLPGFADRLPGGPDRVRCIVLDRLSPEDVARFVVARLAIAGRPGLLEAEAVLTLAQASGGLPRLVDSIGAVAVFLAGLEGSPRVGQRHVEQAARGGEPTGCVPPAESAGVSRDYRGAGLRRRAALGSMVALSGGLFAVSWGLLRRRGILIAAGTQVEGGDAVQVAAAGRPVPFPAAEPSDVVDAAVPVPLDGGGMLDGAGERSQLLAQAAMPHEAVPPAVLAEDAGIAPGLDAPALFRGPIFNETMGQGGRVTLAIGKQRAGGAITARFEASQGLSGSGVLAGRLSGAGRITASGQLFMGKNPFTCDLAGTLSGDTLTGSASFVRNGTGAVYHSRFSLVRA